MDQPPTSECGIHVMYVFNEVITHGNTVSIFKISDYGSFLILQRLCVNYCHNYIIYYDIITHYNFL